jgi:hypothetical protein
MTDYKNKYIKYKNKYLELKNRNQEGGGIWDIYKNTSSYEKLNNIKLRTLYFAFQGAYTIFDKIYQHQHPDEEHPDEEQPESKEYTYQDIGGELENLLNINMNGASEKYVVSILEACRKVLINRTMNSLTTSHEHIGWIKNYLNINQLWLKSFNCCDNRYNYSYVYYEKDKLTYYGQYIYDKLLEGKV